MKFKLIATALASILILGGCQSKIEQAKMTLQYEINDRLKANVDENGNIIIDRKLEIRDNALVYIYEITDEKIFNNFKSRVEAGKKGDIEIFTDECKEFEEILLAKNNKAKVIFEITHNNEIYCQIESDGTLIK